MFLPADTATDRGIMGCLGQGASSNSAFEVFVDDATLILLGGAGTFGGQLRMRSSLWLIPRFLSDVAAGGTFPGVHYDAELPYGSWAFSPAPFNLHKL